MIWTGSTSHGTWALTRADWIGISTAVFGNGDTVTFNDLGSAYPTVTVAPGGVTASDMFVDGATNYTFLGDSITTDAASFYTAAQPTPASAATGKLYKAGTGTLTLSGTGINNFRGGIDINQGAISFYGTSTASTVDVAKNATLAIGDHGVVGNWVNGVLTAANYTLAASSTLTGNGFISITTGVIATTTLFGSSTNNMVLTAPGTGNMTLDGMIEVNVTTSNTLRLSAIAVAGDWYQNVPNPEIATGTKTIVSSTIFGNTITGTGAFHKTGPGTLQLWGSGALGNTGTTIIDQGTVELGGGSVVSAPFIKNTMLLNAGNLTLNYGAATAGTANATNDATAADWVGLTILQNPAPALALTTTITGSSNDIVHITAPTMFSAPTGTFYPQLTGGLHVAIDTGSTTVVLGNPANNFTGIILLDSGTLQIQANTAPLVTLGSTNATRFALNGGALQFTAPTTIPGDISIRAGGGIIDTPAGADSSAGRITTPTAYILTGNITKTGPGTFTNNGAMNGTGTMTIAEGTWIGVASAAATPAIIGGTAGTGTILANYSPVVINQNATLQLSLAPSATANAAPLGFYAGGTFAPTNNGTINNAIIGTGTLQISTGRLALTSAQSNIANINITGPAGGGVALAIQAQVNFPSTTAITADNADLVLAAGNLTLGNVTLKNNATLGFLMLAGAVASSTNPVTGAVTPATYTTFGIPGRTATLASLTTQNESGATPNLYFNIDLVHGTADHLAINAPVTGAFKVNINNVIPVISTTYAAGGISTVYYYSSTIPAQLHATMELIRSPMTTTGTFILDPALVANGIDAGIYKYTVSDTTTATSYLLQITGTGGLGNSAALIYSAAAAMPQTWFTELDSVTQRLGELHLDPRDTKPGFAAWMRGYGSKYNYNDKLTGQPFNELHLGAEAGLDYKIGGIENALYLGLFCGAGQSTRDRTPSVPDCESDSSFGGAYATLVTKTGWYLDTLAKFNRFKNRFTANIAASNESTSAIYRTWAIGASIETGKRADLGYNWFIEPQAQLAFTAMQGAAYATTQGMTATHTPSTTTRARLGLRAGRTIETEKLGTISLYLKGYYGHQWTRNATLTITDPTQTARFTPAIKGPSIEGGAGLAWQFTPRTQLYFDYDTTQADYYIKPYGLNLGLRHQW